MDLPVFSLTPSAKGSDTDDSEAERIKEERRKRFAQTLGGNGIKAVTIQERSFICTYMILYVSIIAICIIHIITCIYIHNYNIQY